MELRTIHHRPRRLDHSHMRLIEFERDILHCPNEQPHVVARCPDCECVMMYRGLARLRNGRLVHYFECVHSALEVHCVSVVVDE